MYICENCGNWLPIMPCIRSGDNFVECSSCNTCHELNLENWMLLLILSIVISFPLTVITCSAIPYDIPFLLSFLVLIPVLAIYFLGMRTILILFFQKVKISATPGAAKKLIDELSSIREEVFGTVYYSNIIGLQEVKKKYGYKFNVEDWDKYIGSMSDIIFNYKGYLEKYENTEIKAAWGLQINKDTSPEDACLCSLDQLDLAGIILKEVLHTKEICFTVGISSGRLSSGNIGSGAKLQFSAYGQPSMIAKKLQKLNKIYKTNIIIDEDTFNKISNKLVAIEIDRIKIKEFDKPIKIYNLIGVDTEDNKALSRIFSSGYKEYIKGVWDVAIGYFSKIEDYNPAYILRERCEKLKSEDLEWNGYFEIII